MIQSARNISNGRQVSIYVWLLPFMAFIEILVLSVFQCIEVTYQTDLKIYAMSSLCV